MINTQETNKFNRSVGILLRNGDEILLCKRTGDDKFGGTWSIPCGHLKDNEDTITGGIREFFEETNIKLPKQLKLIGFIPNENSLMYVYFLDVKEKVNPDLENAVDGHEHSECGWFKYDNLPNPIGEKLGKVINLSKKV